MKNLSPIQEEKSRSPKQKSSTPKKSSSEKTLYKSASPKPKSASPKPKKSILKKPGSENKKGKKIVFDEFVNAAKTYSKNDYDRSSVAKMVVTQSNIKELKKELNELMDSLFIHPDSKKYTKRYN